MLGQVVEVTNDKWLKYRRSGFNCEILMIANYEFFRSSHSKESQSTTLEHILLHGTGPTIVIIRFTI